MCHDNTRATALLKKIIADEATITVNLATADNATNLAPTFLAEMTRRYAGSAIGRQELLGEIVEDASDGLWRRHWIVDAIAGATSIYDPAYLQSNVNGGEGFDRYYASDADRDTQIRTPITDGRFSDDPYDPGGPTNRGVTLEVYANFKGQTIDAGSRPRLISELKSIPDATVEAIYRQRYFEPAQCPAFTAPLALMHFDAAVNHGVGAAIRMLQQVAKVAIDGEIGSETLSAIGARSLVDLIDDYAEIRRARYRALPHFWRFGRGWLKRVDATLALGKSWAEADGITRGLLEPAQIAKGESKMSNETTTAEQTSDDTSKWWAESKTLWGTLITAAATVLPVIAPAIGVSLPADVIQTFGNQTLTAAQAVAGLFGTALAIYGRYKASSVLSRKS